MLRRRTIIRNWNSLAHISLSNPLSQTCIMLSHGRRRSESLLVTETECYRFWSSPGERGGGGRKEERQESLGRCIGSGVLPGHSTVEQTQSNIAPWSPFCYQATRYSGKQGSGKLRCNTRKVLPRTAYCQPKGLRSGLRRRGGVGC